MMASDELRTSLRLETEQIPAYAFPESVAKVLSKIATYSDWLKQQAGIVPDFDDVHAKDAESIIQQALQTRGAGWLTVEETRSILDAFGIPQAPGAVATTPDEAVVIAEKAGFPVAVKLASHNIVHKTEINGVRLNLRTAAEVRSAFEEIRRSLTRPCNPQSS